MKNSNTQIVKAPSLPPAAMAFADREVSDFGNDSPLLPLKAFVFEGDVLTCKYVPQGNQPGDFFDSSGVKVEFRCTASNIEELKVGKTYTQIFFYTHKTIPKILLDKHAQFCRAFLAALSDNEATDANFRPSTVLQECMKEVDELGIKIRVTRELLGYTRNQKPKLDDTYEKIS